MTASFEIKNMFNVLTEEDEILTNKKVIKNKNPIKYRISTSYKGVNSDSLPGHATLFVPNQRTKGFIQLADKDTVSKSLYGTKACRNVLRINGQTEYGICMREKCTYAHSLTEFRLPRCAFGDDCKRRFGTKDKSGKIDKNNRCLFSHPRESIEEYYNRTGLSKPDLPENNEKSSQINLDTNQNEDVSKDIQTKGSWKKPLKMNEISDDSPKNLRTTYMKVPKEHAQKFIDLMLELELYDHEIETF